MTTRLRLSVLLSLCLATPFLQAQSFDECGGFNNLMWDYTDPKNWRPSGDAPQGRIRLVENVHFDANVENLVRGHTAIDPLGDIRYTLNRFPNHPRALWAMSRASRHPKWQSRTNQTQVACFFEKALHLHPNDKSVMMVYGMHLHKSGKLDEAAEKYQRAGQLGLDSSEYHYNYGLLLFDKGEMEEAREQAELAYQKGYPLPGLQKKLSAAGHWP